MEALIFLAIEMSFLARLRSAFSLLIIPSAQTWIQENAMPVMERGLSSLCVPFLLLTCLPRYLISSNISYVQPFMDCSVVGLS